MSAVAPANSTVAAIRKKVRRLTASSSSSTLPDSEIDERINVFYTQDFPYAIKLDQLRDVYTFFTAPNIDRYPLDVNSNQGMRAPVYFEGVQGWFYKDRTQFFNLFPRWPAKFEPAQGDGTTTLFTFTIPGPFLSTQVVIGGTDINDVPIKVVDDGGRNTTQGNLLFITTDDVGNQVPPTPATSPIPPAVPPPANAIGQVNYVTGLFTIDFPVAPKAGSTITVWVSQYNTGRPYYLLFWNNEFTVRPVPDNVYKIEIETYLTPVQFLLTSDDPKLKQWFQYIAYGVALEILRDRNDIEGVSNLMEGFKRQEALVLERQGVEEIGQANRTIFNQQGYGGNFGSPYGWW